MYVSGLSLFGCDRVYADLQSTELFREAGGVKIVEGIMSNGRDANVLDGVFAVVAAAATGNEVLKESFMELKIDELIGQILKVHSGDSIPSIYDAIRVILTSDDNRVLASQVSQPSRTVSNYFPLTKVINP